MPSGKKIILYELNEVPWVVVDSFVASHPHSNLASLMARGQSLTTVLINETAPLQPWRTWPSFHTSQLASDHNSIDLGQDPGTFHGATMWDAAETAGLTVGLFGPMQSWPARPLRTGGFWIPDTFARDEVCFPTSINRFQAFNLAATKENGFSPDTALRPGALARVGYDLVRRGMTAKTAWYLSRSVLRERKDGRNKAGRSILQALPCFDLYWRLHRRHAPALSIFFTNHVAGMMHRYWGDAMADYKTVEPDYVPDPVFATMITRAMEVADAQFGRIRRYVDNHPDTILMIAGSMGQEAIAKGHRPPQVVLSDPERLFKALGLGPIEVGSAMYPSYSLLLSKDDDPDAVIKAFGSLTAANGNAVLDRFRMTGRTLQFSVPYTSGVASPTELMTFTPLGATTSRTEQLDHLGMELRTRLGGANTGYHIPEGITVVYGKGIAPDPSRTRVDLLDKAPSILANILGVPPAPTMAGKPTLFTDLGVTPPATTQPAAAPPVAQASATPA